MHESYTLVELSKGAATGRLGEGAAFDT